MRRFVAFLASLIVLVCVDLLGPAIFPSIEHESGNHEMLTMVALLAAGVTSAIVYTLYPRLSARG
jgi:hypothetical protein